MSIAEIYLNQTNKRIDHPYDYLIPEHLAPKLLPGVRVVVGFGKGKRQLEGFVVRLKETTDFPEAIRPVEEVIDDRPVLTPAQIELCLFMKRHYCSLFYEALGAFVSPVRVEKKRRPADGKTVFEAYAFIEKAYRLKRREALRGSLQKKVVARLSQGDCSRRELLAIGGDVSATLRGLESRGVIEGYFREHCDGEVPQGASRNAAPPQKGGALYKAYRQTAGSRPVLVAEGEMQRRLDFYLEAIAEVLAAGKSAVLLFPEISLSLELEAAFFRHFGSLVAVCHGRQNKKERYGVFRRVQRGEVRVVIGSRAALFLPFDKLGLILVEAEQDASYYAEAAMPKYSTTVVAEKYAALTGARLIFGDELPSVAAMYAADQGRWSLVGAPPAPLFKAPPMVADLQREMKSGNFDFISRKLRTALEDCLAKGERTALLLNKLGYAAYVFCRSCGHVEKCPACQVALRPYNGVLRCHYCGYTRPETKLCPDCGQPKMKALGLGIDQVWAVLKKRYPEAKILKIDGALIQNSYETFQEVQRILDEERVDIVLGTRMLVKFPRLGRVSLGAALLMDSDLNHGDYRSSEETWQLYGKFFRRIQGQGIIQTYDPENAVVQALIKGDAQAFYRGELDYRRLLGYPPAKHLVLLGLFHERAEVAAAEAQRLYEALLEAAGTSGELQFFEPFLSGVIRKTGQTRWKIMVKAGDLTAFYEMIDRVIAGGAIEALASKVSIEIDPPKTL
ncbi:MAG: primosomal protein N' [Eubacterium sp.]|nr:primosomal protein N' [Eubacterium sp.]